MNDEYLDVLPKVELEIGPQIRLLSLIPHRTTPSAREMLEKIYVACSLNPNSESSTFEFAPPKAVVGGIPTTIVGLHIAVFGLSPKQIGAQWNVTPYQWTKIGDQFWCFAERLETIEADIEKKKLLWSCLKILKTS